MFPLLVFAGVRTYSHQPKWGNVPTVLLVHRLWPKSHCERGKERKVSIAIENIHNYTFHQ